VSAVRNRWLVAALVLALVAGVLVWATVGADRQRPAGTADQAAGIRDGGTVRFAASGEPTGFNPNTSANNSPAVQDVVGNVYPSVFRGQPDFSVRLDGELMAGAELTSERPQTVTYRIRGDAVWSDGTPISDDDFTYLWRRSNGSDRRIDVASTTGYQDIESVTGSPDGKTVTARFARPFADWRTLFSNLLPSHYVERQRGGWSTGLDRRPELIPSGGPFRIDDYRPGQSLTLARSPRYWGRPAHLDRIDFRFLPDAMAQAEAIRNGEVDVIYPRPQVDLVRLVQGLPGAASQLRFGLGFEHLTFNVRHPILQELAVREAIALAIDRRQLLERTVGLLSDRAQSSATASGWSASAATRTTRVATAAVTSRPRPPGWTGPAGSRAPAASGSRTGASWCSAMPPPRATPPGPGAVNCSRTSWQGSASTWSCTR
jgi:glutathione transport system substrate-binding protein